MQFVITLEQIGIIIAIVSIVVGVVFGFQSAKDWAKDRNAALFLQYQLQAFNTEFLENLMEIIHSWSWSDSNDFWTKYGPATNRTAFAKFTTIGTTFDSMGVLIKKKYIPVGMVPELMVITIKEFWGKVGPIAEDLARDILRPKAFQNIEYLYTAIGESGEIREA